MKIVTPQGDENRLPRTPNLTLSPQAMEGARQERNSYFHRSQKSLISPALFPHYMEKEGAKQKTDDLENQTSKLGFTKNLGEKTLKDVSKRTESKAR